MQRERRKAPTLVHIKEAAALWGVSVDTMLRYCQKGWVRARRIAGGRGPWRVELGPDGLPVDAAGPSQPPRAA